jgi:hypothetical protein
VTSRQIDRKTFRDSKKPILAMFEHIRHQLIEWFDERRTLEDKTGGLVVAKVAEKLEVATNTRARRYRPVTSFPGQIYEIKSMETQRNYCVSLLQRTYSCFLWQPTGIPCGHDICIILGQEDGDAQKYVPQKYVDPVFTIKEYKETYEKYFFPPDLAIVRGEGPHSAPNSQDEMESSDDESDTLQVQSPATRRPPGRPRKRRIRPAHEKRPARAFTCSRCGQKGHSKRTYREPINQA